MLALSSVRTPTTLPPHKHMRDQDIQTCTLLVRWHAVSNLQPTAVLQAKADANATVLRVPSHGAARPDLLGARPHAHSP